MRSQHHCHLLVMSEDINCDSDRYIYISSIWVNQSKLFDWLWLVVTDFNLIKPSFHQSFNRFHSLCYQLDILESTIYVYTFDIYNVLVIFVVPYSNRWRFDHHLSLGQSFKINLLITSRFSLFEYYLSKQQLCIKTICSRSMVWCRCVVANWWRSDRELSTVVIVIQSIVRYCSLFVWFDCLITYLIINWQSSFRQQTAK